MICPVCEMGILEPLVDEKGYKYHICDSCGSELVTPKDSLYNKALSLANRKKTNGNEKC